MTLFRRAREHKICQALKIFRASNVEPILFKGWAAARYYPPERTRLLGDVDLAVRGKDFALAQALIKSKELNALLIDLHREFRHLDTVPWDDIFSNSELVQTESGSIRVPRAEDHLRLLCVHWLNDGGANRDRLWDIYYLITNRPDSFDWSRCLDVVSPRRRRWIICTIGLTHKYLGLNISDLPFRDEVKQIPEWVIRCVEREWKRGGHIQPLLGSFGSLRLFFDQVSRRLPPNPLRAVIEGEGDLDRRFRFDYQVRVLLRRAIPFFENTGDFFARRLREGWIKTPDQD